MNDSSTGANSTNGADSTTGADSREESAPQMDLLKPDITLQFVREKNHFINSMTLYVIWTTFLKARNPAEITQHVGKMLGFQIKNCDENNFISGFSNLIAGLLLL